MVGPSSNRPCCSSPVGVEPQDKERSPMAPRRATYPLPRSRRCRFASARLPRAPPSARWTSQPWWNATKEVDRMPVAGIDARQIEAFKKEYKASPKSFMLGLEARSIWEGRGLGNLGKVGPWKLGTTSIKKPSRDFSVQLGSWQEVGDALG